MPASSMALKSRALCVTRNPTKILHFDNVTTSLELQCSFLSRIIRLVVQLAHAVWPIVANNIHRNTPKD